MNSKIKYSDMSLSGPNIKEYDSVLASINNILSTRVGERLNNRKFGCRLEDYLFEPFSFTVSKLILSEVVYAISTWEKRVTILPDSNVIPDYDNRSYKLILLLDIKSLDGVYTLSKTFNSKTR